MKTLEEITLGRGDHDRPDDGMCAMEAVAYIQGEPFSGSPACVCPVIAAFMRRWNDDLPDADRNTLLKPLLPLVIGTRSTPTVESRRAFLAIDWYIRTCLPAWLDLTPTLKPHADIVRALAPITDLPKLQAGEAALKAAWAAAEAAPWDEGDGAARAALRAAAASAAASAARTAVRAAPWDWDAAGDAPWAAPWDAAGDAVWAAWDAARAAAWDAIKPTVVTLQNSAVDLLRRMIASGGTAGEEVDRG